MLNPAAAAVGLCNVMLHMLHMTNYTIQKDEERRSINAEEKGWDGWDRTMTRRTRRPDI